MLISGFLTLMLDFASIFCMGLLIHALIFAFVAELLLLPGGRN